MGRVMARLIMSERSTRSISSWTCKSSKPALVADCSLGTGTFAEVRKAVDIETGDLRAIKVSSQVGGRLTSSANCQTSIRKQP